MLFLSKQFAVASTLRVIEIAIAKIAKMRYLDYTDIPGSKRLRQLIARQASAQHAGLEISSNNIFIAPSKKEARAMLKILENKKEIKELNDPLDDPIPLLNSGGIALLDINAQDFDLSCDEQLSIVMVKSDTCIDHLSRLAELIYSRISTVTEAIFEAALEDNLSQDGPIEEAVEVSEVGQKPELPTHLNDILYADVTESERAIRLQTYLDSTGERVAEMDYGTHELPMPPGVADTIKAAWTSRQDTPPSNGAIKKFTEEKMKVTDNDQTQVVEGLGTSPLLYAALDHFKSTCSGSVMTFPNGTYAEFKSAAKVIGLPIKTVDTPETANYKYTVDSIKALLAENPNAILYWNLPFVNPTGAKYTQEEIDKIVNCIQAHNRSGKGPAKVIIDTVFLGVDFYDRDKVDLSQISSDPNSCIMDGVSKRFGMGGFRYGFMRCQDPDLSKAIEETTDRPSSMHQNVAHTLFDRWLEEESRMTLHLKEQNFILKMRYQILRDALKEAGWDVNPCEGGLCLSAKPSESILGKTITKPDESVEVITVDNIAKILLDFGVSANGTDWTGVGVLRWMISGKKEDFEMALARLRDFKAAIAIKNKNN